MKMEKIYSNKNKNNKLRTSAYAIYSVFIALLLMGATVSAQEIAVKGRITDLSTSQGFAGARISVINTKITAMTTEDGTFEIKVPSTDVTLSIDAPGYQSQKVALKNRTEIEIRLLKQTGAASVSKDSEFSTTGSASIFDFSQDIVSIDEDITSRLNGQVRSITHSGTTASGSAIFARGLNSLNASAQPLYVVDGIVWQANEGDASIHSGYFNSPLAVINPWDVEEITVMKDGSSMYGSKGANGVILINTKRSHSLATEIAVDISMGYKAPFKSISVMNADEYRLYASDIISGAGKNVSYKFLDDDKTKSYYKANHNNTDWLDMINDGALTQNYGISVKGGDDIALYAVSVGYTKGDGNIEETGFDRLNFRANSDINMTDKLKLAFDIAFSQTSSKVRNDGIDSISSPYYLAMIKSPLYSPYQFDKNGNITKRISDSDELRVGNPLALTDLGIGKSKQYALNTSLKPTYTFGNDKFIVSALFSYAWKKLDENSFTPDNGVAERPLYNELNEVYALSRNMVQDRMDTHTSIIADGKLTWNPLKDYLHYLTASAGYRYYSDTYKSHYAYGHNTGSDNMTQLNNTTEGLRGSDGIKDNWRSMSWYLNADYMFKTRYLLSASAAMDASSRFGKEADNAIKIGGAAWGVFPSVSAGWIISSESFMKNVNFINFLKLTAGYSITGNDNIPNYASRTYFSSISLYSGANGLILSNIGNNKLKWETTGMAKIGLDFSMFNNRWSVNAELYSSKTKDLLTQKQLSEEAGLEYFWSNDGELKNTGLEVSTNIRILNMRDWKLDFGATIGHYKNEITSLANGTFLTDISGAQILTKVGQPAGVFYGYKTNGVFSTKEDAAAANLSIRDNTGLLIPFEAGDMRFEEVVKDNVIDENDKQIIGDPNPDFYGNFNFSLSWKRFTLGALFTYSYGNDVYNAFRANLEAGSMPYNQSTAMQNRWVANGQITDIPRATYGDPMGNSRFSDRWIEDGSYLRFKSLSLSYNIPIQLAFLQGITVWGSANNIYTFTKYLGADPEFSYGNQVLYQGIDAGLIPQTRSFNLGVKINL